MLELAASCSVLFKVCPSRLQAVVFMGVVLQWANLYGYVRCKVGGKSNLSTMAKNYLTLQIFKQVSQSSQHLHQML